MAPKPVAKPTFAYVKEAIAALKERGGSSQQAIKNYIEKTHPSLKLAPHLLKGALKKGVESKKLAKVNR